MFKLAIFSDEVSQYPKELAAFCKKWKIGAVEIRTLLNKGPHNFSKEERKQIKSVLKDNGLNVCSLRPTPSRRTTPTAPIRAQILQNISDGEVRGGP